MIHIYVVWLFFKLFWCNNPCCSGLSEWSVVFFPCCLSSRHYFACWLVPEARISLALKENQAIVEHLAFILRIRLRCFCDYTSAAVIGVNFLVSLSGFSGVSLFVYEHLSSVHGFKSSLYITILYYSSLGNFWRR